MGSTHFVIIVRVLNKKIPIIYDKGTSFNETANMCQILIEYIITQSILLFRAPLRIKIYLKKLCLKLLFLRSMSPCIFTMRDAPFFNFHSGHLSSWKIQLVYSSDPIYTQSPQKDHDYAEDNESTRAWLE